MKAIFVFIVCVVAAAQAGFLHNHNPGAVVYSAAQYAPVVHSVPVVSTYGHGYTGYSGLNAYPYSAYSYGAYPYNAYSGYGGWVKK